MKAILILVLVLVALGWGNRNQCTGSESRYASRS